MTMKERVAALKARLTSLLPSSESLGLIQSRGGRRAVVAVLGSYALLILGLCIYWSIPPKPFDVVQNRAAYLNSADQSVTGAATTAALLEVTRLLLEKNGGYTSNDIAPPGSLLDNMPNWEYGALIQSRDLARALREVLVVAVAVPRRRRLNARRATNQLPKFELGTPGNGIGIQRCAALSEGLSRSAAR